MNASVTGRVDAAIEFSDNVARIRFEDLPPDVVAHTKRTLLDVLSVGVAGTTAYKSDVLFAMADELGGKEEASIFCSDKKVPAMTAALINATMIRAHDYMDEHYELSTCSAVAVVPAALAIAQKLGNVSGKELVTAVALGMDLMIRMAAAWKEQNSGWSLPAVFGYFGAAAAAAKLLGLDAGGIANALGIAHAQSAGNHQGALDGALTKRLSPGLSSQGGVLAALLAQKGWTGERNALEGRFGFFKLYANGKYDPAALTRDLGRTFEGGGIGVKAYPCCAHAHTAITGVMELVSHHGIRAQDIEKITVGINAFASMVVAEPIELKRAPKAVTTAQFSLPYTVACGVLDGQVVIDSFTEEKIARPEVLKLAGRVHAYVDPEIERACSGQAGAAKVEILLTNGQRHAMTIEHAPGSPRNPLSAKQLDDKIWECMGHGVKPVAPETVQQLIALVNGIEELADVGLVMRLLT